MKKKLLCCALLGGLSMANAAMAQDYDDRWYVSATGGVVGTDNDRHSGNAGLYGIGVGKFITPHVSLDVDLDRYTPTIDPAFTGLHTADWQLTGLGVTGRYHFTKEGRNWWPYLAAGIGSQKHDIKFHGSSLLDGTNFMAKVGAGLQGDMGRYSMRAEAGLRYDFDDDLNQGHYMDVYGAVSLLIKLGDLAPPPAPMAPAAPQQTCADLDDDGDGVNNCNDKCPGSAAGQAIGPDGCPVPLTIDLKGVNFDFDKDTLRPDAVAILDEAVSILGKYPQLRVEVAGHTDSIGTEQYNQGLSERRAKAVYDYLTGHGVDAGRLVGPNGFGESKPIDTNSTKEGRARNRRTELNVQN